MDFTNPLVYGVPVFIAFILFELTYSKTHGDDDLYDWKDLAASGFITSSLCGLLCLRLFLPLFFLRVFMSSLIQWLRGCESIAWVMNHLVMHGTCGYFACQQMILPTIGSIGPIMKYEYFGRPISCTTLQIIIIWVRPFETGGSPFCINPCLFPTSKNYFLSLKLNMLYFQFLYLRLN